MSGCRGWSAGRATALAARTAELSPATSRALPADVAGADVAGVEIDAGEERTFAGDSNAFAGEVVDDLDQEMGKNSSGGCQQRTHPLGPLWMIFLVMIFISSLKATPSEMSNE